MPTPNISRRTLLRGLAAALPLPLLDIMSPAITPRSAFADDAPRSGSAPTRFIWLYQSNGMFPDAWNPDGDGRKFKHAKILSDLVDFRDQTTIIRNLTTDASGPHVGKCSALLTAVQAHRDPELGVFATAKSIDQWIADSYRGQTPLASLELGIERPGQGYCSGVDTPVSYGSTLSWSTRSTRLMPEINPRRAFDLLFCDRSGPQAKEDARWQGSLLDTVREQAGGIRRQGSWLDKQKIDEYLESVRSAERRIQQTLEPVDRAWQPPSTPPKDELAAPPHGVPADRRDQMRLMLDLITLALWTDSSRVATLMMSNTLSDGDFSFIDGVDQPFHSGCSHHQNKAEKIEQYILINQWHAQQTAYLLKRLNSIQEGDRTLLDNSVVFFGSSLKDGDAHSNVDLPIAMFGGGGGRVKHAGHYHCAEKTNVADLHFTMLKCFGIEAGDFNGVQSNVINDLVGNA